LSSSVKGLIAGFACAACVCPPAPAPAVARVDDAAATQAYLRASEAYARAHYAAVRASVAAIEAYGNQIAVECPSALTFAPRDQAFEELGEEAIKTSLYTGLAPVRSALLRLVHVLGHLTWSDRTLTQLVRAEAAQEQAHATLALPDVCADIAAWKASAYAALPQDTHGFLARLEGLESGSTIGPSEESREAAIVRLLRHYERQGQRRAALRIERLLARTSGLLTAAALVARGKLAAALGVSVL
jgi:hypothetical protein